MAFTIVGPIPLVKRVMEDSESKRQLLLIDGAKSKDTLPVDSTTTDIGVYVFAIGKPGAKSILPWYVGKTEKANLGKESLHRDKLFKYSKALERENGGKPYFFFLVPENGWDDNRVDRLETFLIWLARQRNPELLNARKNLSPSQLENVLRTVVVYGLQRSKPGPPTNAVVSFRSMIGWTKAVHIVDN